MFRAPYRYRCADGGSGWALAADADRGCRRGTTPPVTALLNRLGPWATPTFAHNFPITEEHLSAPAVGDFWGNGHQEVAAGYPDGYVRVFDPAKNGQVVYSFYTARARS